MVGELETRSTGQRSRWTSCRSPGNFCILPYSLPWTESNLKLNTAMYCVAPKEIRSVSEILRFQCSLFLKIRTLVYWLKSTLLLQNKCLDTHIYMKIQCLHTIRMQHYCEKNENTWEAGWVRKELALIKSLIYTREKKTRMRRVWIRSTKVGQIYQLTIWNSKILL